PMPPRRTTRSSTRKDSDTLCSWSAMSCSENRPGNCMRWSVAIDPVTAILIWRPLPLHVRTTSVQQRTRRQTGVGAGTGAVRCAAPVRSGGSVERVAAGAGALGVRVVDREALGVDAVHEVDRGAAQVRGAHPVDNDLNPAEVTDLVAVEAALVEEELVAKAGTTA